MRLGVCTIRLLRWKSRQEASQGTSQVARGEVELHAIQLRARGFLRVHWHHAGGRGGDGAPKRGPYRVGDATMVRWVMAAQWVIHRRLANTNKNDSHYHWVVGPCKVEGGYGLGSGAQQRRSRLIPVRTRLRCAG